MTIFDLFSKRQKKHNDEKSDVYVYEEIPEKLKIQIIHIWNDVLGDLEQYSEGISNKYSGGPFNAYKFIVETLCREYGFFVLGKNKQPVYRNYYDEMVRHFLECVEVEKSLDVIELSFRYIDRRTREYGYLSRRQSNEIADEAIEELNERFRENGVGYQYASGEIIRIDSEVIHSEVVKPALRLLHNKEYSGAEEEFLNVHKHYRQGKTKDVISECSKVFESVMKVICEKKNWQYPPNATSNALINVCFENKLIPEFWQQQFVALRSVLESGVPTARNKLGGHGQGSEIIEVPQHIASYVLHMTASAVVFLVEAERNMK